MTTSAAPLPTGVREPSDDGSAPEPLGPRFGAHLTATALASVMQRNLADEERGAAMPLWFMAFGGTVPVGNVVFGPLMDAIGARWVLAIGAVSALGLAWWSDLKRLDEEDFLPVDHGGEPFRPVNANRLF